jgi:hypothetical protein
MRGLKPGSGKRNVLSNFKKLKTGGFTSESAGWDVAPDDVPERKEKLLITLLAEQTPAPTQKTNSHACELLAV